MITGQKHFIVYVVVVAVIAGAVGLLSLNTNTIDNIEPTVLPTQDVQRTPMSVLGTVENVVGSVIYFNNASLHKRAVVTSDARITKQEKTESGPYKFTDVKIGDIKIGDKIVLYYDSVSKDGMEYNVSRVEIFQNE